MTNLNVYAIYAYILAGWETVSNFIGKSFILIAQELGEKLYKYLEDAGLIEERSCASLDEISAWGVRISKLCGLPIDHIEIVLEKNRILFKIKESQVPDEKINKLIQKASWRFLMLPIVSLMFYKLKIEKNLRIRPIKLDIYRENGLLIYDVKLISA